MGQEQNKAKSLMEPCVLGVCIAPNSAPQGHFPAGGQAGCGDSRMLLSGCEDLLVKLQFLHKQMGQ